MKTIKVDGAAERGMTYLAELPAAIPDGQVLVHNSVRPATRLGARGFRAWLAPSPPDATKLEVCPCRWAPDLGPHYRVRSEAPMTGDTEPSKAVVVMTQALNWAYDHATAAIPGLGSAADFAEGHLKSCGGSPEKAIDDLIRWQVGYAGAAGFVSNIGGLITMPVSVPANLASVLLIQLRMVAGIAHLRGYKIDDERVRTLAFICLTGSAAATILQELSISLGTKLSTRLIMQISGAALVKINQAVGFRLVTKAGTTGLINLTKVVPIVGGLVGGAFDAAVTRGIGAVAKNVFKPAPRRRPPTRPNRAVDAGGSQAHRPRSQAAGRSGREDAVS